MGRKSHNPSLAREIARGLKLGQNSESLIELVSEITDPYYRCICFYSIACTSQTKENKIKNLINDANKEVIKVSQSWRRIELLIKVSKILKSLPDGRNKIHFFKKILNLICSEEEKDRNEFFINAAKVFPTSLLHLLLDKSSEFAKYQFESSKAVIRTWTNRNHIDDLISKISSLEGDLKIKLLGYTHLQLNKLNKQVKPSLLELALSSNISEDMQRYIIRTCSSPFDIELFYSSIKNISPSILLNLTARADRKGWSEEARKFYSISKDSISSLEPSNRKQRLLSKLKITYEKLNRIEMAQISKPESFDYDIPQKGVHTLGLFNTYGGSWNHPHIKAVFKASKLCAAFDLDLALINFPKISYDELISEVKKEMRITSNNFLEELYSLERVTFFDKDIDELIVGKKVVTTAKPDLNKIILPDEKLCMIMGLGPKGLPKSYIKKASHHFELTGTNVSFETGTAMGAICSELSFRRI